MDLRKGERGLTVAERIDKYTEKGAQDKVCYKWLAACNREGYPIMGGYNGRNTLVASLLAEIHRFVRPEGKTYCLTRTCGHRWCVNWRHLEYRSRSEITRLTFDVKYAEARKQRAKKRQAVIDKQNATKYDCQACGKVLSAWYTNRKYCDEACRKKVRLGVKRKCKVCKKEYRLAPGIAYKRLYCSPECKQIDINAHVKKYMTPNKILVYFKKCGICQSWFYQRCYKRKTKTCSDQCRRDLRALSQVVRYLQR